MNHSMASLSPCTSNRSHGVAALLTLALLACPSVDAAELLPIEVMSHTNNTASRSVTFTGDFTSATGVFLRVHRPVYRDVSVATAPKAKMSLRVNGGAWTDCTAATVVVDPHEAAYGGLNGALATVRFTVPATGFINGDNTITFRFNGTDGFTMGFRVLDIELRTAAGADLLPAGTLAEDNPALWQPQHPNLVADGQLLWTTASLRESPIDPTIMRASCSDCHAADGRDLTYFNYSDKSIIERSQYHGLTIKEGRSIASYIRSLDVPAPASARPWNPPYQPGPGLDDRPVAEWSAGAGLDSVLDDDADVPAVELGNAVSAASLRAFANIDATENVRHRRIAMQLPDWNEWLPTAYPEDFLGDSFRTTPVRKGRSVEQLYHDTRDLLTNNTVPSLVADGRLKKQLDLFAEAITNLNNTTREALPQLIPSNPDEDALLYGQLVHWGAVKTWEIMQTWELDDEAPGIFGADKGEARSWLSTRRNVFELAPHRLAADSRTLPWQSLLVGRYFSTAWYQLQLTINAGNRSAINLWPVDWNYQPAHISNLNEVGGPAHPWRYFFSNVKMLQFMNDGRGIPEKTNMGFRQMHLGYIVPEMGGRSEMFAVLPVATRVAMYEAIIHATVDLLDRHPASTWPRSDDLTSKDSDNEVQTAGYEPVLITGAKTFRKRLHEGQYADTWFTMIPYYRSAGVGEAALTRLIDWGETMWPLGDWDSLRLPIHRRSVRMQLLPGHTWLLLQPATGLLNQPQDGVQRAHVDPQQVTVLRPLTASPG
jgi:hypothetical protein